MTQEEVDIILVLLELVALALPSVIILMQVISGIYGPDVGTSVQLEFLLARWSLLLFVVSALLIVTYFSITQLPLLFFPILLPIILALIILTGSVAFIGNRGFIGSIKLTVEKLKEKSNQREEE